MKYMCECMENVMRAGEYPQHATMVKFGVLESIARMLEDKDPSIILYMLQALENLFISYRDNTEAE